MRRDDTRKRVRRADGEIDAACDKDERPGRGDDQDRRLLVEDVEQIDLREEGIAPEGQDREQDEERDEDPASLAANRSPVLAWSGGDASCGAIRERRGEDRRLGHGLALQLGDQPAPRMTRTRCARPRISSSSDEMNTIAMPVSASETSSS